MLCFFYLRSHSDGSAILLGRSGRRFLDYAAVERIALMDARAIISVGALIGRIDLSDYIEVEDEAGAVIHSLSFSDAVEIA